MASPIHALPEISGPSMAGKEETHNEANRLLEQGANWFLFKSRTTTAQPGSPADGDCYLLPASATGTDWAGQDGKIAQRISSAWVFLTPREGMAGYVADENAGITYDGAAWAVLSQSAEATAAEIWTGTATDKYISPDKLFDAAAPVTLTDAATIAVDMATGINFNVTLADNRTLGNPTNAKPGQSGRIRVTQDATGSRTLAYGANWKHVGATPVLATAANAIDLFAYFVNGVSDVELSYLGTLV